MMLDDSEWGGRELGTSDLRDSNSRGYGAEDQRDDGKLSNTARSLLDQ